MALFIRQIIESDEKSRICRNILQSLPDWFGIPEAIESYVEEVRQMATWAAYHDNTECGFISINQPNEFTAEIHVMGILKEFHRLGIGKALVETAEQRLREQSFRFLQVKTLSPSRENAEYELTRGFYLKLGFVPVEEFKTLWGEANPCLQLIKVIPNG